MKSCFIASHKRCALYNVNPNMKTSLCFSYYNLSEVVFQTFDKRNVFYAVNMEYQMGLGGYHEKKLFTVKKHPVLFL